MLPGIVPCEVELWDGGATEERRLWKGETPVPLVGATDGAWEGTAVLALPSLSVEVFDDWERRAAEEWVLLSPPRGSPFYDGTFVGRMFSRRCGGNAVWQMLPPDLDELALEGRLV